MMTKQPLLLRSLRIVCTLIVVLCVWSSSGSVVSTGIGFEVDAGGHVLQKADAIPEEPLQRRQNQPREGYYLNQNVDGYPPEPNADSNAKQDDQCGLYLAPSTIPGAGLGIFTSHRRSVGETVGFGEVVIPMVEVPFYNGNKEQLFNPFIHYYWKGPEKALHGIVAEHRVEQVQGFVPGLDAAINCNLALINVDMSGAEYDGGGLNRNKDPMAGAMTPYHTTPSAIMKVIPAGGELFKFYGDRWFVAREDSFGKIPLSEDYPAAQKIIDKFDKLRQHHFSSNPQLKAELWSLAKDTIGTTMWESRRMNALPRNVEDAQKAAESGIESLHQPQAIRSNDFLRQHGKCMDSIRPGPSTLESGQGGRGGFATRDFSAGQIITGSPLHHIPDKELFTIYRMELNHTDSQTGEEVWTRHVDDIVGYQMMLNYCYGHPLSTLLLCPYGSNVGYINHNQTGANVRIQWAQDGVTMHNQSWVRSKHLEALEFEYQVGLAFDYVATRDIQEGEELFLDYGNDFEAAIVKHMAKWQPSSSANYTPAEIFNKETSNSPLRTDAEQSLEPYPENLEIRCHPALVDRLWANGRKPNGDLVWETRELGFPCRILERYSNGTKSDNLYKVEITIPLDEVGRQLIKNKFNYIRKKDVRRSSIAFRNQPYTTDLFLPNTFRKEVGIPDEMLPDHWRNFPRSEKPDKFYDFSIATPYK